MSEIKKNSVTGLYNLQIDDRVFESEEAEHFKIDVQEIENALIGSLPVNVLIELTKEDQFITLNLKRIDRDLVDVIILEVGGWVLVEELSLYLYYKLKEEIIRSVDLNKNKIEFRDIDSDGEFFEYTIRFSATTVGEAIQRASEINNNMNDRMIQVCKQGAKYMRLVANGALQIDISNIIPGKDKNSKV